MLVSGRVLKLFCLRNICYEPAYQSTPLRLSIDLESPTTPSGRKKNAEKFPTLTRTKTPCCSMAIHILSSLLGSNRNQCHLCHLWKSCHSSLCYLCVSIIIIILLCSIKWTHLRTQFIHESAGESKVNQGGFTSIFPVLETRLFVNNWYVFFQYFLGEYIKDTWNQQKGHNHGHKTSGCFWVNGCQWLLRRFVWRWNLGY